MIEKVESNGQLLALILRNSYDKDGLNFMTNKEHSFQVGVHNVKKGTRYKAHKSLPFNNISELKTNKIYYIKEGKVGVDVYNKKNEKVEYLKLESGDLILFVDGGHGLDIIENAKIIEIKQGPYRGVEKDKAFFE